MLNNYEDTSSGFTNSHVQTPANIPRSVETQKQQNIGPTWSYNSQLEGLYSCYQNEHQPVYNLHSMGHFEGNTKHNNNPYPQYSTGSLHQPVPTPIGKCHEACCQHLPERYPINPAPMRYPPNGSVQPPRYGEMSNSDHRQYFTERRPMQTSITRKKEFQTENGYSNASHDRHFQFVGRGQIHVPERQSVQMIRSQYPMYPINSYWSPRNWSGPRMSYPPPPPYHQSVTNQTNQLQSNLKMGEPPHYIDPTVSKSLSSQQRRAIMRNANPEIVRPIPETKRPAGNGSHLQGCYDFPYHSGFVPFNEVNKMPSNIPPQVNSSSCKVPLEKQFQQHQYKMSNNERSVSGCNNPLGEIAYAYPPESYIRNPSNGLQQMTDSRKLSLQYEQQSLGKKRPDLDVRQFLATWDDDEEDGTRISEPSHNNNGLAPYIVVDCRSLEGEAAAKLQDRLKGTSNQTFQSKTQNEIPSSLSTIESKGTGSDDIVLRDTDPQRSLIHSEYSQSSYGPAIHADAEKNLSFWNPENRENCPENDTMMGKGAFQPLDCTKRDNMNVVEPIVASKRDSHIHGDMNHKLINNDPTNHMSFDALVTYYGDSRRVSDGSYDLVEMTERLVNASDKICTIERNPLEQEIPGEGLHPCDPRNLQNQIGANQATYHHRLPTRYASNNYQHYKSGFNNDTFFNFKYPVGSSKFFGFDSSNLDPNFDYHKTPSEFTHQKPFISKDKVVENFQNNSLSKNVDKADVQGMERRESVMGSEILKKQHPLNNYQVSEKSSLDFVGVDPEQFITPIIIKKSDYYNKENYGELKSTKMNNEIMSQGNEKTVLMHPNNVETDILKISHSSSNRHIFHETNVVTLHSGDQTESNTVTVEVPYDEQYSSLVKLSEEITECSRTESSKMQVNGNKETQMVNLKMDSKEKNEFAILKKPTSFKLKRLPNSKDWIKIGGDVSLELKNSESKSSSEVEKSSTISDIPKPTVNLNMPSLDDIRFNDESENKNENNSSSSLKIVDKNNEELSSFSKLSTNETKNYKSDNVQLTQLAIVSPMKFPSRAENHMTMKDQSLTDDLSSPNKDNFDPNEKNFLTSESQLTDHSSLVTHSKKLEVNSHFNAINSPYDAITLDGHTHSPFVNISNKLQNTSDSQENADTVIDTFISESTNLEHNYSDIKKMQSTRNADYTATNQCLDMNNEEILCSGNTEHGTNKESFSSFDNYSECEMNSHMSEYFKLNNRICSTDKDMDVCIPSSPGVEEMFEDINHVNNDDNTFLEKSEEIPFVPRRDSPVIKSPCCRSETFSSDTFSIHDSVAQQCTPNTSLVTTLDFGTERSDEMFSKSKTEENAQQNVKTLPVIPPINLKLNERKKMWCIAKKPKSFEVKPLKDEDVQTKGNCIIYGELTENQESPNSVCGYKDTNIPHALHSSHNSESSLPCKDLTNASNVDSNCFSEVTNEENTTIDISGLTPPENRISINENLEKEKISDKEKLEQTCIFNTSEDLKIHDAFLPSALSVESKNGFLEFAENDHKDHENCNLEENTLHKGNEVKQFTDNLEHEPIPFRSNNENSPGDSNVHELPGLMTSVDNSDELNLNDIDQNSIVVIPSSSNKNVFLTQPVVCLKETSQNVDNDNEIQTNNNCNNSYAVSHLSDEGNPSYISTETVATDTTENNACVEETAMVKSDNNSQDFDSEVSPDTVAVITEKSVLTKNLHMSVVETTEDVSPDLSGPSKENKYVGTVEDGSECDLFQNTDSCNTSVIKSVEPNEICLGNENKTSEGSNKEFQISCQKFRSNVQINNECCEVNFITSYKTKSDVMSEEVSKNSSNNENEKNLNTNVQLTFDSNIPRQNAGNFSPKKCDTEKDNLHLCPVLQFDVDKTLENSCSVERHESSTSDTVSVYDGDLIKSIGPQETIENDEKVFTYLKEDCLNVNRELAEEIENVKSNSGIGLVDSSVSNENDEKLYLKNCSNKEDDTDVELCCSFESVGIDANLHTSESKETGRKVLKDESSVELNNRVDILSESTVTVSLDDSKIDKTQYENEVLSSKKYEYLDSKEVIETSCNLDIVKEIHKENKIENNVPNTFTEEFVSESENVRSTLKPEVSQDYSGSSVLNNINIASDSTVHISEEATSTFHPPDDVLDSEPVLTNQESTFMDNEKETKQKLVQISDNTENEDETVLMEEHIYKDDNIDIISKNLSVEHIDYHDEGVENEETSMKVNFSEEVKNEVMDIKFHNTSFAAKEDKDKEQNNIKQEHNCFIKENEKHVESTDVCNVERFEIASVDQSPISDSENSISNINIIVDKDINDVRQCYEGTEIEYSSEELNFDISYEKCASNQAKDSEISSLSSSSDELVNGNIKCDSNLDSYNKNNTKHDSNAICIEHTTVEDCGLKEMKTCLEVAVSERNVQDKDVFEHTDLDQMSNMKNSFEHENVTEKNSRQSEVKRNENEDEKEKAVIDELHSNDNENSSACDIETINLVSDCADLKRKLSDLEIKDTFKNKKTENLFLNTENAENILKTKITETGDIDSLPGDFCASNYVDNVNHNSEKSFIKLFNCVLSEDDNRTVELNDSTQVEIKTPRMLTESNQNSHFGNEGDETKTRNLISEEVGKDSIAQDDIRSFTSNQNLSTNDEISVPNIDNQYPNNITENITGRLSLFSERGCSINEISKINYLNERNTDSSVREIQSGFEVLSEKEKIINSAVGSNLVVNLNTNNKSEFVKENSEENYEDEFHVSLQSQSDEAMCKAISCIKEQHSDQEPTSLRLNSSGECNGLQEVNVTVSESKNITIQKKCETEISELKLYCKKPTRKVIKKKYTGKYIKKQKNYIKNKGKSIISSETKDEFVRHPDTLLFKLEKKENEICDSKEEKVEQCEPIVTSNFSRPDVQFETHENTIETNCNNNKVSDLLPVENASENDSKIEDKFDILQTSLSEQNLPEEKDDALKTVDDDSATDKTTKQIPGEEQSKHKENINCCNEEELLSNSMPLSELDIGCETKYVTEDKFSIVKSPNSVSKDSLLEETVEKQMEAMHSSEFVHANDITKTKMKGYLSPTLDSLESSVSFDREEIDLSSSENKQLLNEIKCGSSREDECNNTDINKNPLYPVLENLTAVNDQIKDLTQTPSFDPLIPPCNSTRYSEQNILHEQIRNNLTTCHDYNNEQLNINSLLSPDIFTEKSSKRSNSVLSSESISNMMKVHDMDTTPFQCLVEAALAVETAEIANKLAIENSSKACVEDDNSNKLLEVFSDIKNLNVKHNLEMEGHVVDKEIHTNINISTSENIDFVVNKKKTKTKFRFPKPKLKGKKLKKRVAKDYVKLNENDCIKNLKYLKKETDFNQDDHSEESVGTLTEKNTVVVDKTNEEFICNNTIDVCLKTENYLINENHNEGHIFGDIKHCVQSFNTTHKNTSVNITDEIAENVECSRPENDILYVHVNSEKVDDYVKEFSLADIKVIPESEQLNGEEDVENKINMQDNLKVSDVDLETETNVVIIYEELNTTETSEELLENGINIHNIVANYNNLEGNMDEENKLPVEIIVTPASSEFSNTSISDLDSCVNNTELNKNDNILEVSNHGYDDLNANLSNDIANWPYVEEEVTHLDNSVEVDKDIFVTNTNLISGIKCSLPWERIFNIANSKKRKAKRNTQMFASNGLELGPAKIELRLASESGAWKVVNKHNDCISPIVNVKRLILQRDPELLSYSEKESEEEIDIKERRKSLSQSSDDSLPKVVIKKKNQTEYSSFLRIANDKRWQPVVVLIRDKILDDQCIHLRTVHSEYRSTSVSSSNSSHTSSHSLSKVKKKMIKTRKRSISQKSIEKKTKNGNLQTNEHAFSEEEFFQQNPDKEDNFSFTDSIDPAQEYVWRCLDNEEDWMDRSPLQNYCDQQSEKDSFDEDELSFDCNERQHSFNNNYSFINDNHTKRMPENGDIVETGYGNSKSKDWKHLQDSESTCSQRDSIIGARKSDLLHSLSLIFSKNRSRGVKRPSEGHSKEDTKRRRHQRIEKYPFHCQKCCIGFKTKEEMVRHKDSRHPPHRELHHCLLCQRSFSSSIRHSLHVEGRSHRHLELVQRHTMHAVHKLLTGIDFPRIRPLSHSEQLALDWRPNQPGCIHYYHQLTPLQAALQDYSTSQESGEGQLEINKKT